VYVLVGAGNEARFEFVVQPSERRTDLFDRDAGFSEIVFVFVERFHVLSGIADYSDGDIIELG
jgi:hypothetical protein